MSTLSIILHPKVNNFGIKKYRLALRATVNRKRSYYYFGRNIEPKFWNQSAESVKKSHPKYKQLNRLIRKKYDQVDDLIFELESSKEKFTAKEIVDSIRNKVEQKTFFGLADDHIQNLLRAKNHNRAISDKSKINRIKEFIGNRDLTFEQIDQSMLKKLKIFLVAKEGLSERSAMNIFILIRLIYNVAIRDNIVEQKFYPFGRGKIKIKFPQTIKIGLTENEICRIEKLDLECKSAIWHTKNVFLFSFYLAGIRISDVLKLKWSDILEDRLYYKMSKNNKVDSLKLSPKVINILDFYKNEKRTKNDFIFPELKTINIKDSKATYSRIKTSIKKFNTHLSKIAEIAEIDKKITNHIARHSFGNIAGDKVSPHMLQKLYRHTSLSTTINYQGNFIHKNTDEALDTIMNF